MTPTLLRFSDLKARGVVTNWVTLNKWIEREGFPTGRMLGPNTRVWTEDEVAHWLNSRPVDKAPARGIAKRAKREGGADVPSAA